MLQESWDVNMMCVRLSVCLYVCMYVSGCLQVTETYLLNLDKS